MEKSADVTAVADEPAAAAIVVSVVFFPRGCGVVARKPYSARPKIIFAYRAVVIENLSKFDFGGVRRGRKYHGAGL
jgi:hypothetical protein